MLSYLFFILILLFFNSYLFGVLNIFILFCVSVLIGNFLFFELTFIKYLFYFLSVWLIYFLLNCGGKMMNWVYPCFFFIFCGCFLTNKMFMFFVLFEISLIPTYFLVIGGVTPERILASKYLILYTFLGGLPLLFKVLNFSVLHSSVFFFFFNFLEIGFFYFFILAFLIKLPVFFLHLWLPKAHVEASTEGSMILAGVLLKLGSYGLMLFSKFLTFKSYLSIFVIFGGVLAGIFSLVQMDLKSFMAYSSIIHMSYIVFSSFNLVIMGVLGAVLMSVGHGFISAGMFYILSLVYKYTGSRKIYFLKGILKVFYFSMFFCGLCLILNSSAPLSMKFLGEIFMFISGSVIFKFWNFFFVFFLNVIGGLMSMLFFLFLFHGNNGKKSFKISVNNISLIFFLSLFSFIFFPMMKILCK